MIRQSIPRSLLLLAPLSAVATAQDFVVPSGTTVVYDTASDGPLRADHVRIEVGGVLRVVGVPRFELYARASVRIDGELDLSGVSSPGVLTLNTAHFPELGASGGPGGAMGGIGSFLTLASTPLGGMGGITGLPVRGAGGGETGFGGAADDAHRGAGGGGGALGPNQPVVADLDDPANLGLIARRGRNGGSTALGARTQNVEPRGGRAGRTPFVDGDPGNDFFGRRFDAVSGTLVMGELAAPLGGRGGGAGGDAIPGAAFPSSPFTPSSDEKGAGGGGGGGLGILVSPLLAVGSEGQIRANGGAGGGGENTQFFNHTGGGSGGGSGGMLILQSRIIDLRDAGVEALRALGGRGGPGANDVFDVRGAGGDGGPGLIQLHVPAGGLLLPPGASLADLSAPDAWVLLPEPSF